MKVRKVQRRNNYENIGYYLILVFAEFLLFKALYQEVHKRKKDKL